MKKSFGTALVLLLTLGLTPAVSAYDFYVVKPGDSLWSIARKNHTTVERLVALNKLGSYRLQVGDRLKVEEGQAAAVKSSDSNGQGRVSRGNGPVQVYVVKKGDSLWSIARRFGTTVGELVSLNRLSVDKLKPGDKLVVRSKAPSRAAATARSASRPVVPAAPSRGAEPDVSRARAIIDTAMQYCGIGYRYGGASPDGFDCSGFVMYVFGQHGIGLPHSSGAQAGLGSPVDRSDLQPGDLVFFATGGSSGINHVGIYIGDGKFIHASVNSGITIASLDNGTYSNCYVGARRVL